MKKTIEIELKKIVPDAEQPRKYFEPIKLGTLQKSVEKHGIMTPLVVEEMPGGKFLLVDGERRFKVATALKLETVPAIVVKPQSGPDRLIQQFHIQEQHEGWNASEKAIAVFKLSEELNVPLNTMFEMLGIGKRTGSTYMAFAGIIDKKAYQKMNIPVEWAEKINGLKKVCRDAYRNQLEEEFSHDDQKNLEHAILERIKTGEIQSLGDATKLKDAFRADPKCIQEFITNIKVSPESLFIKTHARGAYHLRQVLNLSNYIAAHVKGLISSTGIKIEPEELSRFKVARSALNKLIESVE